MELWTPSNGRALATVPERAHVHTQTPTRVHKHIYTCIHTHTQTHIYTPIHAYKYTYTQGQIHTYTHMKKESGFEER